MSACMMLEHIGEIEKSSKIRKAIAKVIEEGKVKTYDMMKLRGGPEVFKNGACTTQQMTDEIIKNL
jgi:isocitrate dehydrogenase (NAD+)